MGGPGVHSAGTGDDLAADDELDGVVCQSCQYGAAVAGHPDRRRPGRFRPLYGAEDVRCPPAGRDPDDNVRPANRQLLHGCRAAAPVVLSTLRCAAERLVAAGDNGLHHASRDAERGAELSGVEDGKATSRTRAHVYQPAPSGEPLVYDFHRGVDRWRSRDHGLHRPAGVSRNKGHQVGGGKKVKGGQLGTDLLGRKGRPGRRDRPRLARPRGTVPPGLRQAARPHPG